MQPYILGSAKTVDAFASRCPIEAVAGFDVLDPQTLSVFHLVNAGNHLAFGSLAMPAWVQLDCCTLPSAMVGFAVLRNEVDDALWARLQEQVGSTFGLAAQEQLYEYDGLVPISEYCAIPSHEDGLVVGVSLFSLQPGQKLGIRTKALGLACSGAQQQVGITQYTNPAVRVHTAFGPLQIEAARAAAHSRPGETFVYRLRVPRELHRLAATGHSAETADAELVIDVTAATAASKIEELIATRGAMEILAQTPGEGEVVTLHMRATRA